MRASIPINGILVFESNPQKATLCDLTISKRFRAQSIRKAHSSPGVSTSNRRRRRLILTAKMDRRRRAVGAPPAKTKAPQLRRT